MGIINTPIICYSHSSYEDLRVVFFNQIQRLLPEAKNLILFTNEIITPPPTNVRVILFDENLSYSDRVSSCLDQLTEDVCIFHHEDMILYDRPDIPTLNRYIEYVRETSMDYIKLLKGGETRDIPAVGYPNLYHLPHDYALSFTIQPTIWKVEKLKELYTNSAKVGVNGAQAIGNFELLGSSYVNTSNIHGTYHYAGESKRGGNHWDSSVYPHGNFLYKGVWTYNEYPVELDNLFALYNINPNIRGVL